MNKNIVITAALLAALTIIVGAFGAHGLKELISEKSLVSFETGVRYQMYHVIVMLALGLSTGILPKTQKWVFWFFIIGILFFSGSIYLLALNEFLPFDTKLIAFTTPIGGFLLIIGWLRLAYGVIVNK
ncbi:DUF423 domain-containing protein [Flavobacteriaceae bacterium]|nr:hypothetical protein [Flavobacteriaceae bacterium]MDA9025530.1 DUF423 domain-containing protein [bacterium]MDA7824703.1 DUF423 domain-containing protein [Flavobacteriaceae bacterium]MDB9913776.1 DUF423 domain-containing protein [Flavobacteriaceae bacterium]MDB9989515.1 DUF423 domain-containing protein [Flavobacteriaceae bacterium]